jgi:hypothetical protein
MVEISDEFRFIQSVRGHFYPTRGLHLLVHVEELVTGNLNLKVGLFALVGTERVLVKCDCERFGGV